MNIEESIKICKKAKKPIYHEVVGSEWIKGYTSMLGTELDNAIETLLTAYEKEKEKNKKIEEYIKQCDWHDNDVYIGEDILDILEEE